MASQQNVANSLHDVTTYAIQKYFNRLWFKTYFKPTVIHWLFCTKYHVDIAEQQAYI